MSHDPSPYRIAYPCPRKARVRTRSDLGQRSHVPPIPAKRPKTSAVQTGLMDLLSSAPSPRTTLTCRYRPKATSESPSVCIDMYRAALDSSETFMYAIDPRTWVAEIYDPISQEKGRGVDAWVVLQGTFDSSSGGTRFTCSKSCPDKLRYRSDCLHELVLNGSDPPDRLPCSDHDNPTAVAFRWTPTIGAEPALILYCILSTKREPCIVAFNGTFSNVGLWCCRKCPEVTSCVHIEAAKEEGSHQRLLLNTSDAEDLVAQGAYQQVVQHRTAMLGKANRLSLQSLHDERSISYRPVGPPRWCQLDSDTNLSQKMPSSATLPAIFELGVDPRCRCGSPPDPEAQSRLVTCTVFDISGAQRVKVEVKRCSKCPRERNMDAGPDLGGLCLFNLNNSRIFSHGLLNDYTSSMTSLEAPFHSFCDVTKKRYKGTDCGIEFAGEDSFRTAWFSFTRIQHTYSATTCNICGDRPDCIIFDGQTGGFSAEHATSTLQPPTTLMPDSTRWQGAVKAARQTAAVPGAIGKKARLAVRWRMNLNSTGSSPVAGIQVEDVINAPADADGDGDRAQSQQRARLTKRDAGDAAMRSSLDGIANELEGLLPQLASMFRAVVMAPYEPSKEDVRQPYLEFLSQVFAHESILQFVPAATFIPIHWLLADDSNAAAALLVNAPALGLIARMEVQLLRHYTPETKRIAQWLMDRSAKVRAMLPKHTPDPAVPRIVSHKASSDEPLSASENAAGISGVAANWEDDPRETGTFYGRPRIRSRPVYENIPEDSSTDRAVVTEEAKAAGIGCSKYYETYGIQGLTGGIMAAWCPHMICLGFHVIPKGEGRNDVFSALYCYWEVAPRYVVYDFACALAPYCMAREPQFFEKTTFLIDSFHAKGHLHDPRLRAINSSAAECGNAGLRKIRRPLSYMSQRHAIIYTMTFMVVWNRERRLDAQKRQDKVHRMRSHRLPRLHPSPKPAPSHS